MQHVPSPSPAYSQSPLPTVRPAPARRGQPASLRDFEQSSAGGAASHRGLGSTLARSVETGTDQAREDEPRSKGAKGRVTTEEDDERGDGLSEVQRRKQDRWGATYIADEETIRNDYAGQYVQTGARPQNYLRNTAVETRFAEYPKLASLLEHKHALTASPRHSIPPTYLNVDPSTALAQLSPSRFDCILLTPPPETTFAELAALDLSKVASSPGFVWLWVGSGQSPLDLAAADGDVTESPSTSTSRSSLPSSGAGRSCDGIGLEKGRELLSRWGYRRCEDIVWLKTNKRDPGGDLTREPTSLFTSTIEHCLMGIRGTVRRSTDAFFVHCNVDTDVIIWEGDEQDPALKPPELQSIIENFCLGTRRLHLYGSPHALRRGWLTVASPASNGASYSSESVVQPVEREGSATQQRERWGTPREWTRDEWEARWKRPGVPVSTYGVRGAMGGTKAPSEGAIQRVEPLLPFVEELDALRPKSPPPRDGIPSSGGLGRGRGAGLGVTRSGLAMQSTSSNPFPSDRPHGNGYGGTPGRGRGRGRGHNGREDHHLLTPGPMRHDIAPPRMPPARTMPTPSPFPPQFGPPPGQFRPPHPPAPLPQYGSHPPPPVYPSATYPYYHGPPQHPFGPHSQSMPSPYSQVQSPYTAYSPMSPPYPPPPPVPPFAANGYPAPGPNSAHPSPIPQHAYLDSRQLAYVASGMSSLSLSPAPSANGEGELVYPISSRGSTRSRTTSAAESAGASAE